MSEVKNYKIFHPIYSLVAYQMIRVSTIGFNSNTNIHTYFLALLVFQVLKASKEVGQWASVSGATISFKGLAFFRSSNFI